MDSIKHLVANNGLSSLTREQLLTRFFTLKAMSYPFLVRTGPKLLNWLLKKKVPIIPLLRHSLFYQFCAGEDIYEAIQKAKDLSQSGIKTILDYAVEAEENDFQKTFQELRRAVEQIKSLPEVPFIVSKLTGLMESRHLEEFGKNPKKYVKPAAWIQVESWLEELCQECARYNKKVFIDAEESWLQDGIDAIAENLMAKFNQKVPVVFTTIQMYRHDRFTYLLDLFQRSETIGFIPGVKLVRGAYLEKENKRAKDLGIRSPLYGSKGETDVSYDSALKFLLKHLESCSVCIATHNEESIQYSKKLIREQGYNPSDERIYFSQLLGMGDFLTYPLAAEGFNAAKYLPYGPVTKVLPYLFRRAQENTSVQGQTGRELKAVLEEISRRKIKREN